jgi:hypothetical protein
MVSRPWLALEEAFQVDELTVTKPLPPVTPQSAAQFAMSLQKPGHGSDVSDCETETSTWNSCLEEPT